MCALKFTTDAVAAWFSKYEGSRKDNVFLHVQRDSMCAGR